MLANSRYTGSSLATYTERCQDNNLSNVKGDGEEPYRIGFPIVPLSYLSMKHDRNDICSYLAIQPDCFETIKLRPCAIGDVQTLDRLAGDHGMGAEADQDEGRILVEHIESAIDNFLASGLGQCVTANSSSRASKSGFEYCEKFCEAPVRR